MKRKILTLALALTVLLPLQAGDQMPMRLWYDRPAEFFEESLPIGNGKLGALVYGGTDTCVVQLNDITLWTGKPVDRNLDRDAHQWIGPIREALFAEDYARADSLQLHVQGPNSQFFQPLGTLKIVTGSTGVSQYRRELNLDSALVTDSYACDGGTVSREYFASAPDRLIAIRLRGQVGCELQLSSLVPHKVKASPSQLTMTGHAVGDAQESIHFCTIVSVQTDGQVSATDSSLVVSQAKEAIVYIVNETSFNGFDRHPVREGAPYLENAMNDLWHTRNYSYDEFRSRHIADYRHYYDRLHLRLGTTAQRELDTPTSQLLRHYHGDSRYLETLYFQYGRYLLIASSRTPGVPANLQGLWTPHLWSPWRGNYTVNINLEENYWPAFVANLAEMATPLDGFVRALATNGSHTARNYYGIGRGWCSSHNSDIWAMTNPVGEKREKPEWANWNMGGAWLVQALWQRYLFTRDDDYLRRVAFPLMKGAADFCLDWMVEHRGELITAPSTSPENEYVTDRGYHGMTCYGGTADLAIIRELLQSVVEASRLVGTSAEAYQKALERLHPYTIGKEGDLNEWYHDWRDYDPHHRHQSHLIGLYPGSHLLGGPDSLLKACEQTLVQKGEETTGWSTGWRINLWARLKQAGQAFHIYEKLLTYVSPDNYRGPDRRRSGGTYPNLFDAHPPFQIDGNFGGTAGVCEMLLQSHNGTVELLPALPRQWSEGEVKGLCARGGYEIDMTWAGGKVTRATIHASKEGTLNLRFNGKTYTLTMKAGESRQIGASTEKPTYETQYRRLVTDVMNDVARRFDVKFKFDANVDTLGVQLPYADFRIRPYSLEQTLDNICKYFDWNWWKQSGNTYKIKLYEYPRRHEDEGRQMLQWLAAKYSDKSQWEQRREVLRREVRERLEIDRFLDSCVKDAKPILSKVRKHDGYTTQNICLELTPGQHVFGTIYTSLKKGRKPLIVCPDGHWPSRYRDDEQQRLATLARMGAICVDFDLYGYSQSLAEVGDHHSARAHVYQDACGLKLLDWMLTNRAKEIDTTRVAANGGSGGGTHTVLLALLDRRVTCSAPVVHVASHFDGGCPCESGMPVQLAGGGTCEAELAAIIAPQPLLLVSDGGDWTSSNPQLEYPFIQRIFSFYGAQQQVRNVHLPDERHDFGPSKRKAVYDFFADVFGLDRSMIDESKVTIEPVEVMQTNLKQQ